MLNSLKNSFNNKNLLDTALTHKSWINENPGERESNERLEFLGDAVLEFIVSSFIFNKFKKEEEGFLTALRASLVNTANLSRVARKLNLGEIMFLSKGETDTDGRNNESLLADCLEAVIGAIYLDQGIDKVSNFIEKYVLSELSEKLKKPLKDPKSRLQEIIQAKNLHTPKYVVINEVGPDHSKLFAIAVYSNKKLLGKGKGKSKSEAEQKAALKALETFKS